jgi:hypothetical protein
MPAYLAEVSRYRGRLRHHPDARETRMILAADLDLNQYVLHRVRAAETDGTDRITSHHVRFESTDVVVSGPLAEAVRQAARQLRVIRGVGRTPGSAR